jgi:hypothetical protein
MTPSCSFQSTWLGGLNLFPAVTGKSRRVVEVTFVNLLGVLAGFGKRTDPVISSCSVATGAAW